MPVGMFCLHSVASGGHKACQGKDMLHAGCCICVCVRVGRHWMVSVDFVFCMHLNFRRAHHLALSATVPSEVCESPS